MNNEGLNQFNICEYQAEGDNHKVNFNQRREKRKFSFLGFGFALFALISLAVALIIQVVVALISPDILGSKLFLNMLSPVSMYLFALPVLLLVIFRVEAEPPKKRKMGFGKWLLFLLVGFGLMYIGNYTGQAVMRIISNLVGYDYSNALVSLMGSDKLWVTFIFMVIVAPVGEEFVFRKLLIDRTQKYGGFVSVLLSGLIFGLMHGNLYQFFYAFALGLLLGCVYYSTGKLHLTIAIHAVINFFGSIVATWISESIEKMYVETENILEASNEEALEILSKYGPTMILSIIFVLFVFASMICAVVLPIVFRKKLILGKGQIEIPRRKVFSTVFLNAGIIVMLIVYILEFALNLIPAA